MGIKETLNKKGWAEGEINKTLKIVREAKKNKHPAIKILDKAVYWIALIMAIIGNFIISIALMPFLLALNSIQLYLIIVTIGIAFGMLFELLIRSITHLKKGHHLFFGFLIPIVAVVNIFIIAKFADILKKMYMIYNIHNPFVVSVVYAAAFITPYAVYHLFLKE